ncbi:MAG TPA: response regulator, partial [Rudaea sp.]|nr:response regulator [Rudaea sp.]
IMVTAHGREAIQDAAESVGVKRFLIKPVDASVLLDTIVDVLGADIMRTDPPTDHEPTAAPLGGMRVLLAEDNPINQQLAVEMLTDAGMSVDVADNGAEAVRRAEGHRYDAVLMDIEMPEMDGYTAARALRELRPDGPPIVAMTAHATVEHRRRCIEAGMADVVTKPVMFDELIATLRKYIRVPDSAGSNVSSAPPNSDVLDTRTAIARMNGNEALFRKLAAMFPDLHRAAATEIRDAMAQNDLRKVRHIAHSVAGAAGNLGATRLHASAMALENASEPHQLSPASIEDFDRALQDMLRACERYVAGS